MNRITAHPDFQREWNRLKEQQPQACVFIKANLALLVNAEPRTMPELEWHKALNLYTWRFEAEDSSAPFPIEIDLYVQGNEIVLAGLEVL